MAQLQIEQLPALGDNYVYLLHEPQAGMTAVVDSDRRLTGIITDGDLRRKLAAGLDFRDLVAREIMTSHPVTVAAGTMAVEALALMERRKITSVVVIDEDRRVEGVLHLHDLWRTEMV